MADEDDEFSELRGADIDSVHAVGKAANGTQILFAKQAEGAEGVFGADFVRELVAKGEQQDAAPAAEEKFTAAQAMALVHAASVRKADMSTKDINDLPDDAFAHIEPGGSKDSEGKTTPRSKRHYPVHDAAHARNALGRAAEQMKGDDADAKRIASAALPKIKAAAKKFGVEVAKAEFDLGDGGAMEPGSPAWEAQDAACAQDLIEQILAIVPGVKALAQRENTEVAAGHTDDMDDVCDLEQVCDALMCAAKMLGAFAVTEAAEAAPMAKATPAASTDSAATATPTTKENAVSTDGTQNTDTAAATEDVAKAGGLTEAELAEVGRRFLMKKAAKAKKTSGASASDGARVIPGTDTVQEPSQGPDEITKAEANIATALAEVMAPVAKQFGELATQVSTLSERVEKMAAQPDDRKSPLLNGATGEPMLAQRGSGIAKHPEVQAILKSIEDMPDGAAKDTAKQTVGYAAIKARFTPGS
jgi:hypothetical protein